MREKRIKVLIDLTKRESDKSRTLTLFEDNMRPRSYTGSVAIESQVGFMPTSASRNLQKTAYSSFDISQG